MQLICSSLRGPPSRVVWHRQRGTSTHHSSRHWRSLPICRALKEDDDWMARNMDTLRAVPLVAGAMGVSGVLVNRIVSGIAPVVSASSSQSRADVLVIVLSAVLMLTGLQWLSLKPKPPKQVEPEGWEAAYVDSSLPPSLAAELQWAWRALTSATRARSMTVFHRNRCIAQLGAAPEGMVEGSAVPGPICQQAMTNGRGNYLANLVLFPGRVEFSGYLPANMQAALIQPVGKEGVMVVGSDTQRGFSTLDQAWVAALGDKLEVAIENALPASL